MIEIAGWFAAGVLIGVIVGRVSAVVDLIIAHRRKNRCPWCNATPEFPL